MFFQVSGHQPVGRGEFFPQCLGYQDTKLKAGVLQDVLGFFLSTAGHVGQCVYIRQQEEGRGESKQRADFVTISHWLLIWSSRVYSVDDGHWLLIWSSR